jgi:hypothetical protein
LQDAELRYRFIYNAFPTLTEEEVIGKTDMEILSGVGIMEVVEFKKEVMRKGWPEKREFTFNTDLFGEKTFLIALEPVMNKSGQSIGLNYISVDISDQVDKREQLMCLREEGAVQKAMETELNRTIHITGICIFMCHCCCVLYETTFSFVENFSWIATLQMRSA